MNNLALVLGIQGKYAEAKGIHRQALALWEKVLGQEHPSTLTSMNNLAAVLERQGNYEEAEEMHQRALELKGMVLEMERLKTLTGNRELTDFDGEGSDIDSIISQEDPFLATSSITSKSSVMLLR
jgi:tetratricopeptide (TPR) repeat protein